MGGKTGTTNDNADVWFMGYTPQLLAAPGLVVMTALSARKCRRFMDGSAQDLSGKYFFKKVYADKTLGIEKDASFVKPAELENEINSADIMELIDNTPPPAGEGEDQGVGNEQDYQNYEYIGPESKPVKDDDEKDKKDSANKAANLKRDNESKAYRFPS